MGVLVTSCQVCRCHCSQGSFSKCLGPGQPIPGGEIFGGVPRPKDIRTVEQDRIDQQFNAIFDDMLISILTAQKTLGGAFAGLALGIADTLTIEFTKTLRESFITPVIQGLTDLLQEGLKSLFGGLTTGGVKGVFGGILKGIGTIFGGFFAAGGTLGANKFGVVGERGAEIIYSGASPLHVAPMATNTSGMTFMLIQNIHAPTGSVTQRTRDQIAEGHAHGLLRAPIATEAQGRITPASDALHPPGLPISPGGCLFA